MKEMNEIRTKEVGDQLDKNKMIDYELSKSQNRCADLNQIVE